MEHRHKLVKIIGIMIFAFFWVTEGYCSSTTDGSATVVLMGNTVTSQNNPVTIKQIEAAGVSSVSILDPFEKQEKSYQGVWLNKFVETFARPDTVSIVFTAIDDYQITFTKKDWSSVRILLATRDNQQYIDFERKGPLRVILPDYDPAIHSSREVLPKWIWMITQITFK